MLGCEADIWQQGLASMLGGPRLAVRCNGGKFVWLLLLSSSSCESATWVSKHRSKIGGVKLASMVAGGMVQRLPLCSIGQSALETEWGCPLLLGLVKG